MENESPCDMNAQVHMKIYRISLFLFNSTGSNHRWDMTTAYWTLDARVYELFPWWFLSNQHRIRVLRTCWGWVDTKVENKMIFGVRIQCTDSLVLSLSLSAGAHGIWQTNRCYREIVAGLKFANATAICMHASTVHVNDAYSRDSEGSQTTIAFESESVEFESFYRRLISPFGSVSMTKAFWQKCFTFFRN